MMLSKVKYLVLAFITLCVADPDTYSSKGGVYTDLKTHKEGRNTETLSRVKRGDTATPLTDAQIVVVLDKHNTARQSVDPAAANLILTRWDNDLSSLADNQVGQCSLTPIQTPDGFPFSNIFTTFTMTRRNSVQIDTAIGAALDEITTTRQADFDYDTLSCNSGGTDCASYVAMIKDSSHMVGCSIHSCDDTTLGTDPFADEDGAFLFVCIYGDIGELYSSTNVFTQPYVEGGSCEECLTDFPFCDSFYSLCSEVPSVLPNRLEIFVEPGPQSNPAGEPFSIQPSVILLDSEGNLFTSFAYPSCPWYITVSISGSTNLNAELFGRCEVPVIDGYANFTGLGISKFGDYQLSFYVSYPDDIVGEEFEVGSADITIGLPSATFGVCDVEEGDKKFERTYEWKPSCSAVCIGECDGLNDPVCVDLENCGVNAKCVGGECVCNDPNEYENHPLDFDYLDDTLQPELFCMPDYMEMRLDKCGLNAIHYKLSDLYMFGPNDKEGDIEQEKYLDRQIFPFIQACEFNDCRGRVVADSTGLKYSFMIQRNFMDCGGSVVYNDSHITYHHTIQGMGGYSNGVITRRQPIEMDFSCTYVRKLSSTIGMFASPFIRTVRLTIDSEGAFDLSFGLWLDANYMQNIVEPPMIQIPDPIYIGIFVRNENVLLLADTCYATLTDDPDDTTRKDLILNGHAADESVTVTENGESNEAKFNFESFAFVSHPDDTTLYIHCKTIICAQNEEPCTLSAARKRRDVSGESGSVEADVSIGPITVVPSESRRKRDILYERYAASFSSQFSTQEVANPPFRRTTGVGQVSLSYD
ncbi:uncharacterized protein LOC144419864 [Styela clava]